MDLHSLKNSNLNTYGLDLGLIISGVLGSVVLLVKQGFVSYTKSIGSVLVGAACANYLTPVIIHLARIEQIVSFHYSVAFLLGFVGLRAVEYFCEFTWLQGFQKSLTFLHTHKPSDTTTTTTSASSVDPEVPKH